MKLKEWKFSVFLFTALLAPFGVLAQESQAETDLVGPERQTEAEVAGPQKETDVTSEDRDFVGPLAEETTEMEMETETVQTETADTEPVTESTVQEGTVSEDSPAETSLTSETDSNEDSLEELITPTADTVTVASDSDVLDYPGRKDGTVIGEVLEHDELTRTGTIDNTWSQIIFTDDNGEEQTGYIPSSVLEGYESETLSADEDGSLHEGSGVGVFSDAIDGVTSVNGSGDAAEGVVVGTPESASANASLVNLGVFKITHYCPCSICCGPYANGITSTGVTAVTNHTIAVDPTVIPYGSKVVINGQVYVAEDCGSAIKGNRIDIYVGSHAEGEEKGTFNTEVYLLQED